MTYIFKTAEWHYISVLNILNTHTYVILTQLSIPVFKLDLHNFQKFSQHV